MSTKKHKEVRRYRFRVYHFNPKDKSVEAVETATTKPMTEKDFKKVLKDRLAKYDADSYCWEKLK